MSKKQFLFLIPVAIAAATLFASDSKSNVNIPIEKTSATDGKAMFGSYCAPCHGVNGKGNGPLSSSLKRSPANLTMLSRNNGGVYPATHVVGVIRFGTGHEQGVMDLWSTTLDKIDTNSNHDATQLRISNLSRYLETLQAK